jgi:hypothetical protein
MQINMKNYTLHQNCVDILEHNDTIERIFFNENSGKVYFRDKIGSIIGIKHPGIFLGVDLHGIEYFLHNHYQFGTACLVTGNEFKQRMPIWLYELKYTNSPLRVIQIALDEVKRKERYHVVNYNCQDYVNLASNNQRKSESVDKIASNFFFGTLLFVGLSLAFGED